MRLDAYLTEYLNFDSRTKAKEAIERNQVLVNGKLAKPSMQVNRDCTIEILDTENNFVSNGGYKLLKAHSAFKFETANLIFADIGASTGGFTECLLRNGAKKVYAIDVGESLLHERLQADSRVVVMDKTNARNLTESSTQEKVDAITIDVSFISLSNILPACLNILKKDGFIIALIKPQFELSNKNMLNKNGIVTNKKYQLMAIEKVCTLASNLSLKIQGFTNAPINSGKNVEFLIYLSTKKCEELEFSVISRNFFQNKYSK